MNELSEHEIAVLYMMKQMRVAISNRYLIEIFAEAEIIEYYLGLEILNDFEKNGLVRIGEIGGVTHYKITNDGKNICELYENKLPKEIRQRIDECCAKILSGDHDLKRVYTQTSAIRDGVFYFKCGILEQSEPLVELRVRTADGEQAQRMAAYFRSHSDEMYFKTLEILGENI